MRGGENAVEYSDSHQHHFEERAVFVGCGVRAVETNESNTYQRTERKNTFFRGGYQYSRTSEYNRTQYLSYDD